MRYRIVCPQCGENNMHSHSRPKLCPNCGKNLLEAKSPSLSGARNTAEFRMEKLDELLPKLAETWAAFESLRQEWVKHLACVTTYHARGIVSTDEYGRYLGKPWEK